MIRVMSNTAKRGFASLTPEKRKEIAASGGRASHAKGKAHEWTHDEAVAAGKKGRRNGTITNNL